jgi:hypothetical protein
MALASPPSAARLAHRNASVSDCGSTPGEPTRYHAVSAKHASRWFCCAAIFCGRFKKKVTHKKKKRQRESGTYVIVDGQRGVLWTAHLAVFVALAETIRARCVAELRRLRKELRGVFVVDKDDVVDAPLVQERELV